MKSNEGKGLIDTQPQPINTFIFTLMLFLILVNLHGI